MNLETQRETHPDSLAMRDLVVKSSMQASKQRSTKPENIYSHVSMLGDMTCRKCCEVGKEGDIHP